ncbi:unnamed protein product [Orchesella dallaii]|uniref:Major facilitator superfamily (MFS) profile domain-containing protein n=1 Tax=Orchesella dallaii TaxID=48710 RepID=A0ABP1RLP7_9HEXA
MGWAQFPRIIIYLQFLQFFPLFLEPVSFIFRNRQGGSSRKVGWKAPFSLCVGYRLILDAALKTAQETNTLNITSYFTNASVLKSVLIATFLMIFKDACGGNTFSFFVVQTFDKTGTAFSSHVLGVIIGVAQLVGILVTVFCMDKLGRRILLITSFIIMSLSMAILGLFQQFKTDFDELSQYSGEIVPTNVIGSVSGLVTGIGWMIAFIFTRSYPDMNDGIGVANTFWVFAVFAAVGEICTHVFAPETVGKRGRGKHP